MITNAKISLTKPSVTSFMFAVSLGLECTQVMAAPITFNTALPVGQGEIVWRQQLISNQSRSGTGLDKRRETNLVSTVAYGLTQNLTVFANTGLTDRSLTSSGLRRSNFGLTDSSISLRYTAYRKDSTGGTLRFAPLIGVQIPTGDDQQSDSFGELPQSLQNTSGASNYFFGGVLTYSKINWGLDVQLLQQKNGQNQDFRLGDQTQLDLSFRKLLVSTRDYFLNGLIEFNLIDQNASTVNNQLDKSSNTTTTFISPGIQYITQTWIVESSIQLPLSNETGSNTLESDYIARVGFRRNF